MKVQYIRIYNFHGLIINCCTNLNGVTDKLGVQGKKVKKTGDQEVYMNISIFELMRAL